VVAASEGLRLTIPGASSEPQIVSAPLAGRA
jgi:hypothetical protein